MSHLQLVASNPAPLASAVEPAILSLAHSAPNALDAETARIEAGLLDEYMDSLVNMALEALEGEDVGCQIDAIASLYAVPRQVVADGVDAQLELMRD